MLRTLTLLAYHGVFRYDARTVMVFILHLSSVWQTW